MNIVLRTVRTAGTPPPSKSPPPDPSSRGVRGELLSCQLRRARRRDATGIARIYNEAVAHTTATFDTQPRSLATQREWLRRHDARHPVIVAVSGSELAGWASLSPWSERKAYDGTAEVSVYVDPQYRGRGIGRLLLGALLREGKRLGLRTLLARIAEGNPVSLRLHKSAGFRRVGTMHTVGFKFGRWIDVHLLEYLYPRPRRRNAPGKRPRR